MNGDNLSFDSYIVLMFHLERLLYAVPVLGGKKFYEDLKDGVPSERLPWLRMSALVAELLKGTSLAGVVGVLNYQNLSQLLREASIKVGPLTYNLGIPVGSCVLPFLVAYGFASYGLIKGRNTRM